MLAPEARWFADQLAALPADEVYPLCNLGSADAYFRQEVQPWIDRWLFKPARAAGHEVMHVDQKSSAGVDLVGNLEDDAFLDSLAQRGFRSVLCANLLEHVEDPARLAARTLQIVPPGGYLLVSVPYRFPYHEDPIDTLYRPSPDELAALFPGAKLCQQAIIRGGTMFGYLARRLRHPRAIWGSVMRNSAIAAGGAERTNTTDPPESNGTNGAAAGVNKSLFRYVPWFFKSFQVSCVILKKEASPAVV